MLNFIVLGYVPGTEFQITFNMFMLTMLSIMLIALVIFSLLNYEVKQKARSLVAIRLASL